MGSPACSTCTGAHRARRLQALSRRWRPLMKTQRSNRIPTVAGLFAVSLLAACGSMSAKSMAYSQTDLPASVQVPAGNKVAWETVGVARPNGSSPAPMRS
ncbi:hypothetical protein G6F50_016257 [Rhizopus delemar]|uniref:Uncharacterized protein n=1 Tax=Rhizopus delemar TaxID=936053 RepID=A0A9P6XTM8_9FUNG|nr:hypothetical protein G6F50_016257 [Rhizopus delemar]